MKAHRRERFMSGKNGHLLILSGRQILISPSSAVITPQLLRQLCVLLELVEAALSLEAKSVRVSLHCQRKSYHLTIVWPMTAKQPLKHGATKKSRSPRRTKNTNA